MNERTNTSKNIKSNKKVRATKDNKKLQQHKIKLEKRSELSDRIENIQYFNENLRPLVSVVVPIYGAEYTLDEALMSIEKQTLSNIEIICVDDDSPDSSFEIVQEHASNDDRYVIVKHHPNCGYGAAMNDGISVARGKWIAILEPDDYIYPKMYEALTNLLSYYNESEIDVIKSPYIREIRSEGVKRGDKAETCLNCSYRGRVKPAKQPFDMSDASASHLLRHHPSIWSALYRRDFLVDKEIFFVEYPGSGWADNEFLYETLLQADNIVYTDTPYYVYREETDGEFEAFARKNKSLPFDRWNSMQDIVERLNIEDEHIWLSHIAKGFTYLSGEIDANGEDDPIIQEEMEYMFSRMSPELVEKEKKINLHLRNLFNESQGFQPPKSHKAEYLVGLVGEFGYTLKNNGMSYTLKRIKKTVKKK